MAIVDDIKKDRRTKNVLAQPNTKTVSGPPSSTGLSGDTLPDDIFSATDFDLVKNQVHLSIENMELIETLNRLGRITNMQSQSGPIPGTGKIVKFTDSSPTSGQTYTVFTPNVGEVWEIVTADYAAPTSSGQLDSIQLKIKEWSTGEEVMVAENATDDSYDTFKDLFGSTIYVDENMSVTARPNDANLTAITVQLLVVRVR